LRRKFLFYKLFSDLLLSRSDLERDREFKERTESLSALKFCSTHTALAVWNKPPAGI
jgi:hypothetical protein